MIKFLGSFVVLSCFIAANAYGQATVNFDGQNFPCISYNIATAQTAGQPVTLTRTTNTSTIKNNRKLSCGGLAADVTALNNTGGPGTPASCDEYPFASTLQGGGGAQAMIVPAFENNAQGGVLSGFYQTNQIGNGTAFNVTTSNVPAVGGGPGQLTIVVLPSGHLQCHY